MTPEAGETMALNVLNWILSEDDMRGIFMGAAGLSVDDVKQGMAETSFLAGVLDFLCMDDAWVVAFCDYAGLPYEAPMQARAALPGGAETHWT